MASATTIALIFVATIAICSAQMEETLVEEVNGQVAPGIKMSDINPEEGFLEDSEAKGFKPGSMKKILESIQSLRAYCMLAYDKAVEFKKTSSGNSALVNFITFFGKPVSKKKPMNIVLGFATAIGKAKGTFQSGVNNYLLMHLGKAVFEGKKAVVSRKVSGKSMVRMSAKKMGFTSLPHYFDKLAVSMMKFASTEQEVIEGSSNADAQAAAQWLASGSKAKYKSFKELEEEEVAKKVQSYQDDVYMNALKAIKNSWANSHSLAPLPISGTKAGGKVPAVKVPSPEDVNKAAKKAAEAWQKRHSERKRAAEEKAMKKAQEKAEKKVAEKKAKKEKVDKKKEKEKKKKEEKDAKEKKVKEEEKKVKEEKRAKEESKRKAENDAKEKAKKKKEKKVKETNTKETAAKEEKKEQGMKENAAKEKKKEQGMKEKAAKEEKKEQGMKEKAKKETEKKKEKDTKENAAKEEKKEQDMKEKAKKEKKKEQGMKEKAAKETKKEQGTKEKAAKEEDKKKFHWKLPHLLGVYCKKTCGQKKKEYVAKPQCVKRIGGAQASDKECTSRGKTKPAAKTKTCPATKSCYHWHAGIAPTSCPVKCGQPKSTLTGRIYCFNQGSETDHSKCDASSKPAAKTTHCAATDPCAVIGYCKCVVTAYAKANYQRRRRFQQYDTSTEVMDPNSKRWDWGGPGVRRKFTMSNSVDSIAMSSGCRHILVEDDDEEEVLLTTSGLKSRQDKVYYQSIPSLPYDLAEDVKGIRIYAKTGCLQHCGKSNNVCPT